MTILRTFPLSLTHRSYWLPVLLPALLPAGWLLRELPGMSILFAWLLPAALYLLLPLADLLVGRDRHDPDPQAPAPLVAVLVPALAALSYFLTLFWALSVLGRSPETFAPLALLGWVLSLANLGGVIAINVSHELIHRRERWEQRLGGLLLASVWYGCFKLEHPRWHHVKVATTEDPSSAPQGSNVWWRAPRAWVLNTLCGWRLGATAAQQAGRPRWQNEMAAWYGISLLLTVFVFVFFGALAGLVFLAQGLGAALLLEIINYVEHYGLRRERRQDGRWMRPEKRHSWDADFWLSNALLIQLPRHADHHVNPGRPFTQLQRSAEAPRLPFGYATAVLVALLPPLWRRVIDPRIPGRQ